MELAGKTALVLGATKGIGKACALALAARGVRLVIPFFDWPEESTATLAELQALRIPHLALKTDLRQPEQVETLLAQTASHFGGLDILVNNIERGGMPIVHGPYNEEQWELEMATTLKAKWWVFKHALPLLQAADQGVVVNLSSIAGQIGRCGPAAPLFNDGYAAANRAVSSFTESWARQAGATVRVNELRLGFIASRHAEGTRGWSLLSPAQQEAIRRHTLLGRTGTVAEVVRCLLFLIEEATFMTGAVLTLDGGYLLGNEEVPDLPPGMEDGLAVREPAHERVNPPSSI